MAKLHEILAVESNLRGQAEKTRTEQVASFEKKRHLFEASVKTFYPLEEGAPPTTEEIRELQTTVRQELHWISEFLIRAMDVSYQVAEANTEARSDVYLEDGTIILNDVPATALLDLEKRIAEVKTLVDAIPTLDPAKGFKLDPDRGEGVYAAREVIKYRSKKSQRPLVLYAATKEHPAQVQLVSEDIQVGKISEKEWSGLITPADKAGMISRTEELLRAVRKARSRANESEVPKDVRRVGGALLSYVFGQ